MIYARRPRIVRSWWDAQQTAKAEKELKKQRKTQYMRELRDKNKAVYRQGRTASNALHRAKTRLGGLHSEELRALYNQERDRVGLEPVGTNSRGPGVGARMMLRGGLSSRDGAAYRALYRLENPENTRQMNEGAKALQRALTTLGRRHPDELEVLYNEERHSVGLPPVGASPMGRPSSYRRQDVGL